MKKSKKIIGLALAVLTVAGLYAWKEYTRGHTATASIEPADQKVARELVAAFEADEDNANKLYNDKVILVKGKVQKVAVEDNMISISLSGDSPLSGVLCQFEKTELENLHEIKAGDTVAIKGICTGYLMDVILVRCVLN